MENLSVGTIFEDSHIPLRKWLAAWIHTNTVEGYFANLKRGLGGVYHHVGKKYLDLYLAEFDHRYSERKSSDGERTITGIAKAGGKRLTLRRPTKQQ